MKSIDGFNLNGSVWIKLLLLIRLFYAILNVWPWIKIGIFLSSWWSVVPSFRSWSFQFSLYRAYTVSCHIFLLCDNTTLNFELRPWKTIGWSIDSGTNGSFCILLTISYYVTIRPWPLNLKNNSLLPLIMLQM